MRRLRGVKKFIVFLTITSIILLFTFSSIESEKYYLNLYDEGYSLDKISTKLLLIAKYFYDSGNKDIPIGIYNYVLSTDPSNTFVINKKTEFLLNEKRYVVLKDHYDFLEKAGAIPNLEPFDHAFILTSIQRYGEAISIYEKFIDENYSLDGWKLRKEVMKQMYPGSELEIKLEPIFKSAKSFESKHEFSQALRYYENILLIDKYNVDALTGIISVSIKSDNYDEAKKNYAKLIKYQKLEVKTPLYSAVKEYEKFKSDYINTLRELALLYENQAEYRGAFDVYIDITSFDKFSEVGLLGVAKTSEKLGFIPLAIQAYETLTALDPLNHEYKQKIESLKKIRI